MVALVKERTRQRWSIKPQPLARPLIEARRIPSDGDNLAGSLRWRNKCQPVRIDTKVLN
jgi:hypothetical protein